MVIDPDSKAIFRKELTKLVNSTMEGLSTGNFYDTSGNFSVGKYERERGILCGLGYALNLLEDPATPKSEPLEENENGDTENN